MTLEIIQSSAHKILDSLLETFHEPRIQNGLALIGLAFTTKWAICKTLQLGTAVRIYILPGVFPRKQRNWKKDFGEWAVVTGSTDGIGKEFARQLASQGMNIVLISRNPEKLNVVALEISRDFPSVKTKVIAVNFSEANPATYKKVEEELLNYEIGLLVNNVGVYVDYPMPFDKLDVGSIWDHVSVNVGSVSMMTRIILPQMKGRKKGGIINISSISSYYPMPLIASYSASKIYVDYMSEALRRENKEFNIQILNLNPFYIGTNMTKFSSRISTRSILVPTPEEYVRSALKTFGVVPSCTGYLTHALQGGLFEVSPWLFRHVVDSHQTTLWRDGERSN